VSVLGPVVEVVVAVDAVVATVGLLSILVLSRKLWRLRGARHPSALKIFVSHREPEKTRAYPLPVTGVGQLLAVAAMTPSLVRTYGWRWKEPFTIRPGTARPASDLGGNLILLGGVSRNKVTEKFLERCGEEIGVGQRYGDPDLYGDRILWRHDDDSWECIGGTPRPADGGHGEIRIDHALVLRMPNPWDDDPRKQCVVFAGVHTYGTGAAAAYFVRQWWKPLWWHRQGVAAVIEVEVVDGHALRSKRIRFRRLG